MFNVEKTADLFKNRYRNYVTSFKTIIMRHSTFLAYFVWRLQEDKIKYNLI